MARRRPTQEQIEAREQELAQARERIETAAVELANSDQWRDWLRVASKFHNYSFRNTLLIQLQRPDATAVAGYRAWQSMGRQVDRGEKGLRIFAPITKRTEKVNRAGEPIRDENGKIQKESKVVGLKLTSVFDVSQTSGDPLPEPPRAQLLRGEAPEGLWDRLAEIVDAQGFDLIRRDVSPANGVTDFMAQTVTVRPDLDPAQAVKTLAHELGHVLLHRPTGEDAWMTGSNRGRAEVEAESVAALVMDAHGMDSAAYTTPYVAGWAQSALSGAGEDATLGSIIAETGDRVIKTARTIIDQTDAPADAGTQARARSREDVQSRAETEQPPTVREDAPAPSLAERAREVANSNSEPELSPVDLTEAAPAQAQQVQPRLI